MVGLLHLTLVTFAGIQPISLLAFLANMRDADTIGATDAVMMRVLSYHLEYETRDVPE